MVADLVVLIVDVGPGERVGRAGADDPVVRQVELLRRDRAVVDRPGTFLLALQIVMKPTPPMPLIHGSSAPIAMPVATACSRSRCRPCAGFPRRLQAAGQFWATTTPLPRTACLVILTCRVSDSLILRPCLVADGL
jgi:hypothetical protein